MAGKIGNNPEGIEKDGLDNSQNVASAGISNNTKGWEFLGGKFDNNAEGAGIEDATEKWAHDLDERTRTKYESMKDYYDEEAKRKNETAKSLWQELDGFYKTAGIEPPHSKGPSGPATYTPEGLAQRDAAIELLVEKYYPGVNCNFGHHLVERSITQPGVGSFSLSFNGSREEVIEQLQDWITDKNLPIDAVAVDGQDYFVLPILKRVGNTLIPVKDACQILFVEREKVEQVY